MIDLMKSNIEETKKDLDSASDEITKLKSRLDIIEGKLSEWNIPAMKDELSKLKADLEKMKENMGTQSGKAAVEGYAKKVDDLMNALNNPNVSVAQVRGIIVELRDELRGWKNRVQSLREEVNSLESEISELRESVSNMDSLEVDVKSVAETMGFILDKILEIEKKMASIEKTQEDILRFEKEVSSVEPASKREAEFSDESIEKARKKLSDIGKRKPFQQSLHPSIQGGQAKKEKPKKTSTLKENIPIVEEITIGDEKPKKTETKSSMEDEVMSILNTLKNTDPKKWSIYKSDLIKALSKAIDDTRKDIARVKPPNEQTLSLLLSKAELGVVSLEAMFDLGDYNRIEAIVRNTLSTIRDVESQLNK